MIRPAALNEAIPWLDRMAPAHHAGTSRPGTPLAINWDLLCQMEDAGNLLCLVAIDQAEVVGYSLHAIAAHPLYGELWATPIALYVRYSHRELGFGRQLVEVAEVELARRGAVVICQAVPAGGSALAVMLSGLGYWRTETLWSKRLPVARR